MIDRDDKKDSTKVMLEEGLEDVENLVDQEKHEDNKELKEDGLGAKYLKLINTVSFYQ